MESLFKTLIIVGVLDAIVLILVIVLFRYLHSQATAEGAGPGLSKFKAGGALAGFLVLMAFQMYAIRSFMPAGKESHSSYQALSEFYQKLQKRDYSAAWNVLSPDMQNRARWGGSVARFANGFKNTQDISMLVSEFASTHNPYLDEYIVYYMDKTEVPILPGLERLGDRRVGDLPAITESVAQLRARLVGAGLAASALDEMKIEQLVTAVRGDILRWRLENGASSTKTEALFPATKTVSRLVGKRITIGLQAKKWLIQNIEDIPLNEE